MDGFILCLKVSRVSIWFKHSFCLERVVDIIIKVSMKIIEVNLGIYIWVRVRGTWGNRGTI